MITITKDNFSIKQICESGQCFRLERINMPGEQSNVVKMAEAERYNLIAFGKYLEIAQEGNRLSFDCKQEEFDSLWKSYFDLEEDYGRIIASIDGEDDYLFKAASYGSGIRILRQDLWEMIVSFIVSQQNNIKRIRKCISFLCRRYGEEKAAASGKRYYDFPTAKALAGATFEDLYACNLGYRSKYVVRAAKAVDSGQMDLKAIKEMPYKKAREELMKFFVVVEKVADCICLFALHHLSAFPVDTHIKQAMERHYKRGFPNRRYQEIRGVMQQYIFYYELHGNKD